MTGGPRGRTDRVRLHRAYTPCAGLPINFDAVSRWGTAANMPCSAVDRWLGAILTWESAPAQRGALSEGA
jgi:hypothetical protein